MAEWREGVQERWQALQERWQMEDHGGLVALVLVALLLLMLGLGWYWSREPELFSVKPEANAAPGHALALTSAQLAHTLLEKPGGYIRNDWLPPGVFLDNMPAWELGVVHQLRDVSRALHRDMSLSHATYIEDKDLAVAEPQFNVDPDSWLLPSTESEFRLGLKALQSYADRLALSEGQRAQFYPRADYLQRWLSDVDLSLGRLSTRLNAALPDHGLQLAGEAALPLQERSSWTEVDNVFYEARGSSWALLHLLKAAELEFKPVLEQRHAMLSLRAAIHELEATQQTVWSPLILNGSGFGLFANHSLVMANYLNRAQTDLRDVRSLLQD